MCHGDDEHRGRGVAELMAAVYDDGDGDECEGDRSANDIGDGDSVGDTSASDIGDGVSEVIALLIMSSHSL